MVIQQNTRIEIKESAEDVFISPFASNVPTDFVKKKSDVFSLKANEMVARLLKDAEGNPALALHRLMRHMHNIGAGSSLNSASLKLAKIRLEEMSGNQKKKL